MKLFFTFCFCLLSSLLYVYSFSNTNITSASSAKVCSITDFEVTSIENCNGELVDLYFTFTGTDFGSNGYTVQMNGFGNQTYQLGDPQYYTLIAYCNGPITLTIFDNDDPTCSLTIEYGPVCCECDLNAEISLNECVNNTFDAVLYVRENFGSCANYYFEFYVDGVLYPYERNSNVYYYTAHDIQSNNDTITFKVCTGTPDLEQCIEFKLANPCFSAISGFVFDTNNSVCNNDSITYNFSFFGDAFGINGFTLNTNIGISKIFSYDDELMFTLPANCSDYVIVTIEDNEHPWIYDEFILGQLCCPCVSYYTPFLDSCTTDAIYLGFATNDTSSMCSSPEYFVFIGSTVDTFITDVDTFYIDSIPYTDSLIQVLLCTKVDTNLVCDTFLLANPCYIPPSIECNISGFTYTVDSLCSNTTRMINFSIIANDSFGIYGFGIRNDFGFVQHFTLDDTFAFAYHADCGIDRILTIYDLKYPDCKLSVVLEPICCPCEVNYNVTTTSCLDNQFSVNIQPEYISGSCVHFVSEVTILDSLYIFQTDNSPHDIGPFTSQDSIIEMQICYIISALEECNTISIPNPCFVIDSSICSLLHFDIQADTSACNGEVKDFYFTIEGIDFGTNGYTISSNTGQTFAFDSQDDQVFTILADCDTQNTIFTIFDNDDNSCSLTDTIPDICCPCAIDILASVSVCEDSTFDATFSIDYTSGSCINYDFEFYISNNLYEYSISNNQYLLSNIVSLDSILSVDICTNTPGLIECFNTRIINPCYTDIVNTIDVDFTQDFSIIGNHYSHTITNNSDNNLVFSVFDSQGKLIVNSIKVEGKSITTIPTHNWLPGLYILSTQKDNNIHSQKFVVTK